jgi:hypothetical protein
MTKNKTYEQLLDEVRCLQDQGRLPIWPTRAQRIDWAYGNTVIENDQVTLAMAEQSADRCPGRED